MACANVRYGFLLRSIAVDRAGKSSARIIADALVVRAFAAYFGLARNVICPAPASSIPATPVISRSGEPFSTRALRVEAMSASFIVNPHKVAYSREGWQALLASPQDRIEAVRPAIEKLGGKIKSAWFAFGEYDVVLVTEM